MAIKEILDKIRKALPEDTEERIKEWLADASNEAGIMADAISARNKENERLRKAKEELEQKLSELSASADALKKKDEELQHLKNMLAEKEKKEYEDLVSQWEKAMKILSIPETDKRYSQVQKVRNYFKIPKENETLTINDLKENLTKFQLLQDTGIFSEPEKVNEASGKPPIPANTNNIEPEPLTAGQALVQKLKAQEKAQKT